MTSPIPDTALAPAAGATRTATAHPESPAGLPPLDDWSYRAVWKRLPRGLGTQDGKHVFGGHVLVLHRLVRRPSHVEVDDVQMEGLDGVVRVDVEEEAHLPSQRRGMGSLGAARQAARPSRAVSTPCCRCTGP